MKQVHKVIMTLTLTVVLVLGLVGCGKTIGDMDVDAGESAIYIQEDGKVTYAVSEKFDKDYYDEDSLEDAINQEVEDYNASGNASIKNAIAVDTFKVKSDIATVVLEFATAYDFLKYVHNYNNVENDKFYIGQISDNTGCKIEGEFVSADKKETVTEKEIKEMEDTNILIVNEKYKVQLDEDIKYISANCTIDEDGIITTAKAEDGLSYIVYE